MRLVPLLLVGVFVVACGSDDETAASPASTPSPPAATAASTEGTKGEGRAARGGTKIVLGDSEFGSMLFSSRRQAIYIFQRDSKGRSRCFGECAEAWPPVYTKGAPRAGRGVKASLLGTIKRGSRRQVTYAGKPLYYYAHEDPGQVLCHNVNLNGGLWWVVGPSGRRRP